MAKITPSSQGGEAAFKKIRLDEWGGEGERKTSSPLPIFVPFFFFLLLPRENLGK